MKSRLMQLIFLLAPAMIITGKILNWIIGFEDSTNQLINKAMYIFIGLSYLIFGFFHDQIKFKLTTITCGLFLISMNFLPKNDYMNAMGIISMLLPLLIRRFIIKEETDKSVINQ